MDRRLRRRNGGERFAILLPDTEAGAAREIAERVRSAIAEISLPGSDVSVTASIGMAASPGRPARWTGSSGSPTPALTARRRAPG